MKKSTKLKSSKGNIYIGIDPGKSGSIAVIKDSTPKKITYTQIPSTPLETFLLFKAIADEFRTENICCVIEKVNTHKQGKVSAGTFMYGVGVLHTCLAAVGISYTETIPRTWQKTLSISSRKETESKTDFKKRLLAFAQKVYPTLPLWQENQTTKLVHCDAILIAYYNKQFINKEN